MGSGDQDDKETKEEMNTDEEMTTEDIVHNNNVVLNTLIDLLVEKGVVLEEDLMKKLEDDVDEKSDEE